MLPDDSVFRFDTKACSHSSPKVRSLLSSHILPVLSPPSLVSISLSFSLLQSNKNKVLTWWLNEISSCVVLCYFPLFTLQSIKGAFNYFGNFVQAVPIKDITCTRIPQIWLFMCNANVNSVSHFHLGFLHIYIFEKYILKPTSWYANREMITTSCWEFLEHYH